MMNDHRQTTGSMNNNNTTVVVNGQKMSLGGWTYAQLRDTINNSNSKFLTANLPLKNVTVKIRFYIYFF